MFAHTDILTQKWCKVQWHGFGPHPILIIWTLQYDDIGEPCFMYLRLKFVRAERSSYDIGVQVERRGGEEVMNFC